MLYDSSSVHPYGSFWLDVLDKGIKGAAVIVGGVWAYFNFQRSRTYRRKLEPSITGEIFAKDDGFFVHVSCGLRNVGQSVYTIEQEGTGLEAITLSPKGRNTLSTSAVFVAHGWIEPGEQIVDPMLLPIPDPKTFVGIKLNLRIVSTGVEWNASCIVRSSESKAVEVAQLGGDHEGK